MKKHKRIVVKVGTKVIAAPDGNLDLGRIESITGQIAAVMKDGVEVLLVTSGAIGAGMGILNMRKRPVALSDLQATAAVGQGYLMHVYGEFFKKAGHPVGQILLTQEDFDDRRRFLNIKHTINSLLSHGAIPVINENDTVATDEIKCGDNDRISGLVADLCGAGMIIMLTDVDGLLDRNGAVIRVVPEVSRDIAGLGGKSCGTFGTGGMATKIEAAKAVTRSGIECVIANGGKADVLRKALAGEECGTVFLSRKADLIAKKRWIAYSSRPKGAITIDDGAREALVAKHKSLLASGIRSVTGDFGRSETVSVVDMNKKELARGLAGYSADEIRKIMGRRTPEIRGILGRKGPDEVIHRNNLVML
jgi:glutamate 5-kinase